MAVIFQTIALYILAALAMKAVVDKKVAENHG